MSLHQTIFYSVRLVIIPLSSTPIESIQQIRHLCLEGRYPLFFFERHSAKHYSAPWSTLDPIYMAMLFWAHVWVADWALLSLL